jgi:hypothetical protein
MMLPVLQLLVNAAAAAASLQRQCNQSSFPRSLNDTQCYGSAQRVASARTADQCAAACCAEASCFLWNFADGSHRQGQANGCWVAPRPGSKKRPSCVAGRLGWVGGERPAPPPQPPPPPPGRPPEAAGAAIRLDHAARGLRFDGLGAIIDASSRLMFDYPEPQRSEILDFLFRPGFGAGLGIAKVEVPP